MARRRGWMLFALGLVLALGAGALVFVVLQRQALAAAEQSRAEALREFAPPPTMQLPVAARPLEPGSKIDSSSYVLKDFPLDLVPVNAISEISSLENKVLVRPVGQGETFHSDQFLGGQGTTISQQIKQGYQLFAFPIVDLMSKSNLIHEGDHIDLLLTLPLAKPDGTQASDDKITMLTLQNIEVFKVLRGANQDGGEAEGEAVSLLCSVKPEDAVMIKFIKDSGGTIDFTPRSPVDQEPFQAPAIDRTDLEKRYLIK